MSSILSERWKKFPLIFLTLSLQDLSIFCEMRTYYILQSIIYLNNPLEYDILKIYFILKYFRLYSTIITALHVIQYIN